MARPVARFVTTFVFALAAIVIAGGNGWALTYRYETQIRGGVRSDFQSFRRMVRKTLTDIRGWTLNFNVTFSEVSSGEDLTIILASPRAVKDASPGCSAQWSCRVGDDVLINDERWRNPPAVWPRSRRAYRLYVINHELGHWFGLGHIDCPGDGKDAPVLMQQSKGLHGCNARVWPKRWERSRVADTLGVDGWPTPPRDAICAVKGTHPRSGPANNRFDSCDYHRSRGSRLEITWRNFAAPIPD